MIYAFDRCFFIKNSDEKVLRRYWVNAFILTKE